MGLYIMTPAHPAHLVVPSLCLLVVDNLFRRFWSFFIDGCSVDRCGFGVLVRGGELRVFLFYHLGRSPRTVHILILGWVTYLGHGG